MDWRHAVSLFTADTTARTLDNGVVDFFWFSRDFRVNKNSKREIVTQVSWVDGKRQRNPELPFFQLPVAGQQQTPFPSLRKQTRHGSPPLIRSCSPSAPNSLKAGSYKLVSWGLLRSEKGRRRRKRKKVESSKRSAFFFFFSPPPWMEPDVRDVS